MHPAACAADDFDKVHAEAGRLWYDNYLNALSLRDPGGVTAVVPIAHSLELAPAIRYCARCASSVAVGMGVPGARAEDAETLVRALERAYAEPGPHLIEAVVA